VSELPQWLSDVCSRVVARVRAIDGIAAIALGGSHSRGTARPDSDVDLALYYDPDAPFSVEELDHAARDLDDRHPERVVTRFGDWGLGVNGGGWLIVGGHHIDFLYRDLTRVRHVIELCREGRPDAVYQLGHPMGFQNQIYLGEAHFCRPLFDPAGELAALKQLASDYPPKLRRALIDKHLFDAQFEIDIAAKPAARGDTAYVSGCLFRASGFMMLVLYALNQRFFVNEKGAFLESAGFSILPPGFHDDIARILGGIGSDPQSLGASVAAMRSIAGRLAALCAKEFPPPNAPP
jgi:predicted nucleotidyltransferase